MKKLLLLFSSLCFTWSLYALNINTKDYKFEMAIPSGFEFRLIEPKGYVKIEGYNEMTDTNIHAYAFFYEDFTRANLVNFGLVNFGANESGIDATKWEKVPDGTSDNGFAWWDTYETRVGESCFME
ncbi:hypothetical protein [Reichenbachiella sp.]|uniref:hypothetical protein n=1 Tax=Reichenbachiella sp. TaxID=2184521 RepID=UPI003BAEA8AE